MSDIKPTTLGELRVRTQFNPSLSSNVDLVKQKVAELINIMEGARNQAIGGEHARLCSIAQTEFEGAGMWAVKALTYNK